MKKIRYASTVVVLLVLAAPASARAQSGDWWGWALESLVERNAGGDRYGAAGRWDEDREDWDDRDDRERYEDRDRRDRSRRGEGPKFCRNGRGHPVHGLAWCREKGFDDGYSRLDPRTRWEDRGWEDVILGSPRDRRARVSQGGLIDVLGDVVFGRLDRERQRLGGRAPLEGRWLYPRGGGRVLQIRSGGIPVAELSDLDGDGRVDATLTPLR